MMHGENDGIRYIQTPKPPNSQAPPSVSVVTADVARTPGLLDALGEWIVDVTGFSAFAPPNHVHWRVWVSNLQKSDKSVPELGMNPP
jgi:hypothetical protein